MQTEQIDEIREMFRNDDGSCKLSRSDVLRIVDKLADQQAAQPSVKADGLRAGQKMSIFTDGSKSSKARGANR